MSVQGLLLSQKGLNGHILVWKSQLCNGTLPWGTCFVQLECYILEATLHMWENDVAKEIVVFTMAQNKRDSSKKKLSKRRHVFKKWIS